MKTSRTIIALAMLGLLMSVSAYDATVNSCNRAENPILAWIHTNFGATAVYDVPQNPPTNNPNYPCKTTWTATNQVCINWEVLEPKWREFVTKQGERMRQMALKIKDMMKPDGPLDKFNRLSQNVQMFVTRMENMPPGLRDSLPVNPVALPTVARVLQNQPPSGTTPTIESYTSTTSTLCSSLPPPPPPTTAAGTTSGTMPPPPTTTAANCIQPTVFTGRNPPPANTACDPSQDPASCRNIAGSMAALFNAARTACTATANASCPQMRVSADGAAIPPPCTPPACTPNPRSFVIGGSAPDPTAAEPATRREGSVQFVDNLRTVLSPATRESQGEAFRTAGPKCFENIIRGRNQLLCRLGSGKGHTNVDQVLGTVAFPEEFAITIVKECNKVFRFNFSVAMVESLLKTFKLAQEIALNPAAANVPPPVPPTSFLPGAVASTNFRPRIVENCNRALPYCGVTTCDTTKFNCGKETPPGAPPLCPYPECEFCGVKLDKTYADCSIPNGPPVSTVALNPPSVSAGPLSQLKICDRIEKNTHSLDDISVSFMNFFTMHGSALAEGSSTLANNVAASSSGAPTTLTRRILEGSETNGGPGIFMTTEVAPIAQVDAIPGVAPTVNLNEPAPTAQAFTGRVAVGLMIMALAVFAF
jgi:hypothetical protein